MANVLSLARSFTGGELSPEFFGQISDARFQTGLATCRNMIVYPHGPTVNRPGTIFVAGVKTDAKATRLIPFTYNTDQTFAIEMGEEYLRFHTQGATLLTGTVTAWSSSTAYNAGDLALSGGVNYYCIGANTNNAPPNATYWYAMPSGNIVEVPTPFLEADVFDIHYVQSEDVLTLVHPGYAPRELDRLSSVNWTLTPIVFTPTLVPPVPNVIGNAKGTDYFYQYVVTSVSADGLTESVASGPAGGSSVNLTAITNANPGVFTTSAAHGLSVGNAVTFQGVQGMTQLNGNNYVINTVPTTTTFTIADTAGNVIDTTAYGTFTSPTSKTITNVTVANPGVFTTSTAHGLSVGNTVYLSGIVGGHGGGGTQMTYGTGIPLNGSFYLVGTVPSSTTLTLNKFDNSGPIDTSNSVAYASGGTINPPGAVLRGGVKNNLFITGGANTISWPDIASADHYNIYKFSGGVYGYIGQTAGTSFVDDNITADISQTPPVYDTVFQAPNNYPGAVSYDQQRRVFGGSTNQPQNLWFTRTGTESNMAYSLPIRDDDRIAFRIAARDANTIRHIVPLRVLILLTSSAEWQITTLNSDALTPTTVSVQSQAHVGASDVTPCAINNLLLYAAARGGHIRELSYSWQANGYVSNDLCLRAPHLFDGFDITDMTYAKSPRSMLWATSTNGTLLGLTYVPEQQILAWHRHDTFTEAGQSAFESVCAVDEGVEDALYVVVNRTINGVQHRFIERFASRAFTTIANVFFVDCGVTLTGSGLTSASGLTWLEGETISILSDGRVQAQAVVTGGAVSWQDAGSTIQLGLPIQADVQTLPFATEAVQAFAQGVAKNINKVWMRVNTSGSVGVGPDFDSLRPQVPRVAEAYGTPPALKTTVIETELDEAWSADGQLCIRMADPLPFTLVSMTMEGSVGD